MASELSKRNEEIKQPVREQEQETAWIKAFLAGEKGAFDQLMLRYKDKVFNLCYRFLGDYDDAGDCAQDTFVKAYRALKSFKFGSSFSTWLYAIAVNTCKNKLKSAEHRYRKKMVRIDAEKEGEKSLSREIEDSAPSPLDQLAKKEKEALLRSAITALPEEARAVIVLRDIQGLSYEEIARVTGYNMGTVKSKLARARQQLREKLKGVI